MDAVVTVALITGGVSIFGVVISSIVSKIIEYRQNIKRFLYEKKEEPYSEFIEMVYKIQENANGKKLILIKKCLRIYLAFQRN